MRWLDSWPQIAKEMFPGVLRVLAAMWRWCGSTRPTGLTQNVLNRLRMLGNDRQQHSRGRVWP